jgi:hypothetical protein
MLAQTNDQFHHVQVRPSDAFTEFRTPLAGDTTLTMRRDGCDIREGRVGPDEWVVESVLVPVDAVEDGDAAIDQARWIVDDLES